MTQHPITNKILRKLRIFCQVNFKGTAKTFLNENSNNNNFHNKIAIILLN